MDTGVARGLDPTATTTTPTLQPTLTTISPERAEDLHIREAAHDLSDSEQADLNLMRSNSLMPPAARIQPDDPIFAATAKKYNLPDNVLPGIMATESGDWRNPWAGGDPGLVPKVTPPMAPSSARGLMQITKDGGVYGVDDYNWSNPYVSVDVAGHMLRDKIDQHGGDLDAGLNSYGGAGIGKNPADYNQRVRHAMGLVAAGRPGAAPATDAPTGDASTDALPHGDQLPVYPAPQGFVFHHSAGSNLPSLVTTLHQRGLASEYVMDRDGTIYALGKPGSSHMLPGANFRGSAAPDLTNENSLGMEVVAKDDADVTPKQVAAANAFIAKNYPDVPVYGHGEVNPGHKQPSEGMTIVKSIRDGRTALAKKRGEPEPTAVAGPPTAAAPAAESPEFIPAQQTGRVTSTPVLDPETGQPVEPQTEAPRPGISPLRVTGGGAVPDIKPGAEMTPPQVAGTTPTTRTLGRALLEKGEEAWRPMMPEENEPWYRRGARYLQWITPPPGRVLMASPGIAAGALWERYGGNLEGTPTQGEGGAQPGQPLPRSPTARTEGEDVGTAANLVPLAVGVGQGVRSLYYGGRSPFPLSYLPEQEPGLLPGSSVRRDIRAAQEADRAAATASENVATARQRVTAARQQGVEEGQAWRDAHDQAVQDARRGAQQDLETMRGQQRDIEDVEGQARRDLPDATDQAVGALRAHQDQIERDFLQQRDVARRQEGIGYNRRRLQALDQLAAPEGGAPEGTRPAPPGTEGRSAGRALRNLREEGYTGPASVTAPEVAPTRAPSQEMNPALVEHRAEMQRLGERLGNYQDLVNQAQRATDPATRLRLAQQAERLAETEIPEVTRAASLQRQLEQLGPEGRQGLTRAMQDRRAALQGQLNDITDRMDQATEYLNRSAEARMTPAQQGLEEAQAGQRQARAAQQQYQGTPRRITPIRKPIARALKWGGGLAATYYGGAHAIRAYRALSDY